MSDTIAKTIAKRRPIDTGEVSHNLVGQKLGRKGAKTRERVVEAMLRLLDDPQGPPVTLSSVAREAAVGVTSLYLYFPDLGDLLLAALRRVEETAEAAFIHLLREYWPDKVLDERCLAFHAAYMRFWRRHARLLHMRNKFADAFDVRVLEWRQNRAMPIIDMLVRQMEGPATRTDNPCFRMAVVVVTGMERMASVVTNPHFSLTADSLVEGNVHLYADKLMLAEAELVALAVRDQRRRRRTAEKMGLETGPGEGSAGADPSAARE